MIDARRSFGRIPAILAVRLSSRRSPSARWPVRRLRGVRPGAVVGERFVYPLPRGGAAGRRRGGGQSALGWGPGTAPWNQQVQVGQDPGDDLLAFDHGNDLHGRATAGAEQRIGFLNGRKVGLLIRWSSAMAGRRIQQARPLQKLLQKKRPGPPLLVENDQQAVGSDPHLCRAASSVTCFVVGRVYTA